MKKHILGKLALALMVAASVQTASVGVEAASCNHVYLASGIYVQENYSSISSTQHQYDNCEIMECIECGDIYHSKRSTGTESHGSETEEVWYYNEWCIRKFCPQCGHQFSIGPKN